MKTIKIGTHTVKIIEMRLPTSANVDGLTDWDDSAIYIEAGLKSTAFNATLMHEILEFINLCTDQLIFGEKEDMKEQKISTLAEFLVPFIRKELLK